jgi:methyl-accepting chemotaxis protein
MFIKNVKIGAKLVVPIVGMILLLTIVLSFYSIREFSVYIEDEYTKNAKTALNVLESDIQSKVKESAAMIDQLSANKVLADYIAKNNRAALIDLANSEIKIDSMNSIIICDNNGNLIYNSNRPEVVAQDLKNSKLISAILEGKKINQIAENLDGKLAIVSGYIIKGLDNQPAGAVLYSNRLDDNSMIEKYRNNFDADFTLYLSDIRVCATLKDESGKSMVGTKMPSEVADKVISEGKEFVGKAKVNGVTRLSYYKPIKDENGKSIGAIFAGYQLDKVELQNSSLIKNIIIIAIISFIIIIFAVLFVIRVVIIKPLHSNLQIANQIAKGDFAEISTKDTGDEFGELTNSMQSMRASIIKMLEDIRLISEAAAKGDIEKRADSKAHLGKFSEVVETVNQAIDAIIEPLSISVESLSAIAKGEMPPKIDAEMNGAYGSLKIGINSCIDSVRMLINDSKELVKAAKEGKLDVRANPDALKGDFKEIIIGINQTLDAVVGPLNVAAEYIDRISKGDIPPRVVDNYAGDFNEIKNNLNLLIDSMNSVLHESKNIASNIENGDVKFRGDASRLSGEWKKLVQGMNLIIEEMNAPLQIAINNLESISDGIAPELISEDYKGDFDTIKASVNKCSSAIKLMIEDAHKLAKAAIDGKLDIRADATKHKGDFRLIISGFNETLDSVIGPLNVAAEYVDRISKGDMPPKIVDNYKGDFNEIKNNLNQCIDAIQLLINDSKKISESATVGDLSSRAEIIRHQGDFKKIVQGINNTLDAIDEPMREASAILEKMANGDMTSIMIGEYRGVYNNLKSNVNEVSISLNNLIFEIAGAVESVSQVSFEISDAAETIAASASEQSAQADEVAGAVESMTKTISENAASAAKTAKEAEYNGNIAKEGGEVVVQTVDKMRDIAKVVKKSTETIEKLGDSSKRIGEIISVIDDIADQTNLLALNAAIEAARAGEQGRGFAVVADEVRKLAERTSEATRQIATMIKTVQSETQEAVDAMKLGDVEVGAGIELADKAGEALSKILASAKKLGEMVGYIADASEKQSSMSEEIAKNVLSISQVSNDSSRQIHDIASASSQMEKLTTNLKSSVNQFVIDNNTKSFQPNNSRKLKETKLIE